MEIKYELLIENENPYLRNLTSGVKEYEIICISSDSKFINVVALTFTDKTKMYAKNIKGLTADIMRDTLPQCYV